ncbi:MAG: D-alanyl-D-alanine carboxypeptidase [Rhodospirillales bacterium]|nr:D-alanyl-D-alanine carboxypeptidase [Rhodospirillales bacterium]
MDIRKLALAAAIAATGLWLPNLADAQQRPQQQRGQQQPAPPRPAAPARPSPTSDAMPDLAARQAIVLDYQTGFVMFERNADERMPPSSMSKVMTAYLVFDAIKQKKLALDDMLPVSERAWRMQGSKMFVPLNGRVKVEDLIRGMIIQSGNDACVVLAEALAGSEEAFADQMNVVARRIGLTGSNFRNSTGWPDPDHYMTARDLATLAHRMIDDHAEFYKYYHELSFTYGKDERTGKEITQGNRNPLLYKNIGADGMKTGHTEAAGYGLVASALRDGRRVIGVFNGWSSMRQRAEESERIVDWAFREFQTYRMFTAGQDVDRVDIWLGTKGGTNLLAAQDVAITMPRRLRPQLQVKVVYDSPVPAPVAAGQKLGRIVMTAPGLAPVEVPLVAQESVDKLGYSGRLSAAFNQLIFGARK